MSDHFLDIKKLLDYLNNNYAYVVVKSDSPYVPDKFPDTYPIGKDLDILCHAPDLSNILQFIVENYDSVANKNNFKTRMVSEHYGFRYRCEQRTITNTLHYQIDVSFHLNDTSPSFSKQIIENREFNGKYYIPSELHEIMLRSYYYSRKPNKTWHAKWIENKIKSVV